MEYLSQITYNTSRSKSIDSLKLYFDPIQDLNGYDYAFPSGGGSNLLEVSEDTKVMHNSSSYANWTEDNNTITVTGNSYFGYYLECLPNTKYTFSFVSSHIGSNIHQRIWQFTEKPTTFTSTSQMLVNETTNNTVQNGRCVVNVTTPSDCTYIVAGFYIYQVTDPITITEMQVEKGSVATKYNAYGSSNICPISGWDSIKARKCGKNLAKIIGYSTSNPVSSYSSSRDISNKYGTTINITDYSGPTDELIITQSAANSPDNLSTFNNGYFSIVLDHLPFGQKYNISFKVSNITSNILNAKLEDIRLYSPSGSASGNIIYKDSRLLFKNYRFTQNASRPERCAVEIRNCGMSFTLSEFMITVADEEDFTFEPYRGEEFDVSFPGTIYGGYVDLAKGEIVQEYFYYEITGNEVFTNSVTNWVTLYVPLDEDYRPIAAYPSKGFCTHYQYAPYTAGSIGVMYNERTITFDQRIRNAEEWKQYCKDQYEAGTPVTVVYKLKDPIHYPITPETLKALKGFNTIFSTGNAKVEIQCNESALISLLKLRRKIILNEPHLDSYSGNTARFSTDLSIPLKSCKAYFSPRQLETGDPTPDNIRPIKGYDGLTLYNTNSLPIDYILDTTEVLGVTWTVGANGLTTAEGSPTSWASAKIGHISVDGDEILYMRFAGDLNNLTYNSPFLFDADGTRISASFSSDNILKDGLDLSSYPSTKRVMVGLKRYANDVAMNDGSACICVTKDSPGVIETHPITFPNTIYGGYVDFVSGELIQEWYSVTRKLSDAYNTITYDNCIFYDFREQASTDIVNNSTQKCSIAPYSFNLKDGVVPHFYGYSSTTLGNNFNIRIMMYVPLDTDPETEFTFVAPLAEPITYQLTPQQIKTLVGRNNLHSEGYRIETSFWTHLRESLSPYQFVEYLTSSYDAILDTGVPGNNDNLRFEFAVMATKYSQYQRAFFGNYLSGEYNGWLFTLGSSETYIAFTSNTKLGSLTSYNHGSSVINNLITGTLSKVGGLNAVIGNSLPHKAPSTVLAEKYSNTNIALGHNRCAPEGLSPNTYINRFYYFRIYDNGVLIRDYWPCVRKADGKTGFYDFVNKTFTTSYTEYDFGLPT